MGVILSAFLAARDSIKNSRDKKKAIKDPPNEVAPAATTEQPFAPSQTHEAVQGVQDEHLASVPPPATTGPEGVGQVERNIAVEAPLPVS